MQGEETWFLDDMCDASWTTPIGPACAGLVDVPVVAAGWCVGYDEEWGVEGVSYRHDYLDGPMTHVCNGPRCRPLDRVVLGPPGAFTPEIERCFCDWGGRTSPPGELGGVPTWCGGTYQAPAPQPLPGPFPRGENYINYL
jgi:hypothetical protein